MRRTSLAVACMILATTGAVAPARAVDTEPSVGVPDLSAARALIKDKNFAAAARALSAMSDTVTHPDVYSLLGFSLRKSGDLGRAETYYAKALDFDPDHKGALEYQGELFVQTGRLDRAKANLGRLVTLCPKGCDEREDLERAITSAGLAEGRKVP